MFSSSSSDHVFSLGSCATRQDRRRANAAVSTCPSSAISWATCDRARLVGRRKTSPLTVTVCSNGGSSSCRGAIFSAARLNSIFSPHCGHAVHHCNAGPKHEQRSCTSARLRRPSGQSATLSPRVSGKAVWIASSPRSSGCRCRPRSHRERKSALLRARIPVPYAVTVVRLGSVGSLTPVSRSHPSFSSLICSIAMALALASRSGNA